MLAALVFTLLPSRGFPHFLVCAVMIVSWTLHGPEPGYGRIDIEAGALSTLASR